MITTGSNCIHRICYVIDRNVISPSYQQINLGVKRPGTGKSSNMLLTTRSKIHDTKTKRIISQKRRSGWLSIIPCIIEGAY